MALNWQGWSRDLEGYLRQVARLERYVENKIERDKALPTVRQAARSLNKRQLEILEMVEDSQRLSYNIGIQVPGRGYYVEISIGDYTLEIE